MPAQPPTMKNRDGSQSLPGDERGVSSVMGTIMMVAVTVIVFGGVALAVFDRVSEAPDNQTARLTASGDGDQSLILTHRGGEALRLENGHILMTLNGTSSTVPLTDLADQTADGTRWIIGESICVIGTDASCMAAPGTSITDLQVVYGNSIILSYGGGTA